MHFWRFQNAITLAENNTFWSSKKHLVAGGSLTWGSWRSKSLVCCFWQKRVSPDTFYRIKIAVLRQSYRILKSSKNTGNYSIYMAELQLRFPEIDIFGISKSNFSYIYFPIILKLMFLELKTFFHVIIFNKALLIFFGLLKVKLVFGGPHVLHTNTSEILILSKQSPDSKSQNDVLIWKGDTLGIVSHRCCTSSPSGPHSVVHGWTVCQSDNSQSTGTGCRNLLMRLSNIGITV